jgi:hypothetical protein
MTLPQCWQVTLSDISNLFSVGVAAQRVLGTPLRVRDQYFLERLISEDKDNYYGRVHAMMSQNKTLVSARSRSISLLASRNLFESLSASGVFAAK